MKKRKPRTVRCTVYAHQRRQLKLIAVPYASLVRIIGRFGPGGDMPRNFWLNPAQARRLRNALNRALALPLRGRRLK